MWTIRWLRRFIRQRTTRIPEDRASFWKRRLSVVYAIIAWNAFGMVCWMVYSGRGDWAKYYGYKSEEEANMPVGRQWAQLLNIQNATVVRVSGLRKKYEYEIKAEENDDITTVESEQK